MGNEISNDASVQREVVVPDIENQLFTLEDLEKNNELMRKKEIEVKKIIVNPEPDEAPNITIVEGEYPNIGSKEQRAIDRTRKITKKRMDRRKMLERKKVDSTPPPLNENEIDNEVSKHFEAITSMKSHNELEEYLRKNVKNRTL